MTALSYPQAVLKNVLIGEKLDWIAGTDAPVPVYALKVDMSGRNYSSSHRRSPDGKYRQGGPWHMYKKERTRSQSTHVVYRSGYPFPAYKGGFYCTPSFPANLFSTEESSWEDAFRFGAEALVKLRPDVPDFQPVTSLVELKDFIPELKLGLKSIVDKVTRARPPKYRDMPTPAKHYADRHLANQFGYIPLAKDIANFFEAFQGRKTRFDQLLRDEGKSVHRFAGLGSEEIVQPAVVTNFSSGFNSHMLPSLVTQCYAGAATGLRAHTVDRSTITHSTWCEGSLRYWLPPGPRDDVWTRSMYRKILGLSLSPSQLYNLIPWSWLVDYFSGLGSFMDAVSGGVADRLVFDYAYIMRTSETKIVRESTQYVISSTKTVNGQVQSTYIASTATSSARYVFKRRCPATPFGWGLTTESLTPHQIGILGALGLSKIA